MSRTAVRDLAEGQQIEQDFLLKECRFGTTKNGSPFARLLLGDATGAIPAIFWDLPEEAVPVLKRATYLRVSGAIGNYRNAPQVKVTSVAEAEVGPEEAAEFLPSTDKDTDELFARLREITLSVENEHLSRFVEAIFADESIVSGLKRAPAASRLHHAYVGGLLEHTLSIAEAALGICEHYSDLNRDLLLVGVLIHDIGKIEEFTYETDIAYSAAGRLVGHVAIGTGIVERKAAQVEGFPPELLDVLKHFVLSHHGTPEFGALRQPMTGEALALHYLDNLDAKLAAFFKAAGEEADEEGWTRWQRMFESYLYTGDVLDENARTRRRDDEESPDKRGGESLF